MYRVLEFTNRNEVYMEHKENKEHKEHKEQKENKEHKEHKEHKPPLRLENLDQFE